MITTLQIDPGVSFSQPTERFDLSPLTSGYVAEEPQLAEVDGCCYRQGHHALSPVQLHETGRTEYIH